VYNCNFDSIDLMPTKKITIAIDGPSGSGKSTTAKRISKELGYRYIDSGAMYRAVTWYFLSHNINWKSKKELEAGIAEIEIEVKLSPGGDTFTYLNGQMVEREIRSMPVSDHVSEVSSLPEVRRAMVLLQRETGKSKAVVMDGRDIGTNVFPDAELKIFMIADKMIRAKRRKKQMGERGIQGTMQEVLDNMEKRDKLDSNRDLNPLKKAEDSIELDNSNLSIEEQVDFVLTRAKEILQKN
jgi:CMP/dCMP kinase